MQIGQKADKFRPLQNLIKNHLLRLGFEVWVNIISIRINRKIGGMLSSLATYLYRTIDRGEIPLNRGGFGGPLNFPSSVKCSKFGNFQIFMKIPVFCVRIPGNALFSHDFLVSDVIVQKCNDDDAPRK